MRADRFPLVRRLRREKRQGNRRVVLLYHRISRFRPDPQLLSVTPEHFAEHLEVIAEEYVPVRLADLAGADREAGAPARALAVTFDDGYADNLDSAKRLLERSGLPATVFVTSGYVRRGRPFWWDELERLLLRPGSLPGALTLEVAGETLRWELGDDSEYTPARFAERVGWNVLERRDPGPRQRIYRELCARLRTLDDPAREAVLAELRSVAWIADTAETELPRPLTVGELRRLAEGGLIEIGAHTVTHPVLAQLRPHEQRAEVEGSKDELEAVLARPVTSFAYPYGTQADFDETTVRLVREAGFRHAWTSTPGGLDGEADPLRLPRLVVRDWSGDGLARRLSAIEA